jgi:DNA repair protein RecO (recombination protein O)
VPKIKDKGIIIANRKFGESSLLIKIFSQNHGVYFSLVKNALNKKNIYIYQAGNLVDFNWIAKNENDLGFFKIEIIKSNLNNIISSKVKIESFNKIFLIIDRLIPDRDNHPDLFIELLEIISKSNLEDQKFLFFYIKFFFFLIKDLGYGADFSKCAVSNLNNVAFVSPKTGNAVCFEVGKKYEHKLLKIPKFLLQKEVKTYSDDIKNGIKLLDFFLKKYEIIK